MRDPLKAVALSDGVGQTRRRTLGRGWGAGRSLPARPAVVVSDEQIIDLVAAAGALSHSQRCRHAAPASVQARERLLRLDWAVRAGRLVLADRSASRAVTGSPLIATSQRWRVGL